MSPYKDRLRIDLLADRYRRAMLSGDFDAQERLWKHAALNADVEAAFYQVHRDLVEERETDFVGAIARTVAETMPSAELPRPAGADVTILEVTAELTRAGVAGWTAAEHDLNDRVKAAGIELPKELGLGEVLDWAERHFGPEPASLQKYWAAFAGTARRLETRAQSDYRVAARRTQRKREGEG